MPQPGCGFANIRGVVGATGETTRDDTIINAELAAAYPLREWLGLSATFRTTFDETDFQAEGGDDPGYRRFEVFGGATAAF